MSGEVLCPDGMRSGDFVQFVPRRKSALGNFGRIEHRTEHPLSFRRRLRFGRQTLQSHRERATIAQRGRRKIDLEKRHDPGIGEVPMRINEARHHGASAEVAASASRLHLPGDLLEVPDLHDAPAFRQNSLGFRPVLIHREDNAVEIKGLSH